MSAIHTPMKVMCISVPEHQAYSRGKIQKPTWKPGLLKTYSVIIVAPCPLRKKETYYGLAEAPAGYYFNSKCFIPITE